VWILEFSADKNGCDYYESRSLDEINDGLDVDDDDYDEYADQDDDFPNFIGDSLVEEAIKSCFGSDVEYEIDDQEKGYFCVSIHLRLVTQGDL